MRDKEQSSAAGSSWVASPTMRRSSTRRLQNWYRGAATRHRGASTTFVTKRGAARAGRPRFSWTQVGGPGRRSPGSTPSVILQGDAIRWAIPLGGADQQLPAGRYGTKMIPHRKNTRSTHLSRASRQGTGRTPIRRLVRIQKGATARETTAVRLAPARDRSGAHHCPDIEVEEHSLAGSARGLPPQDRRGTALLLHAGGHLEEDASR